MILYLLHFLFLITLLYKLLYDVCLQIGCISEYCLQCVDYDVCYGYIRGNTASIESYVEKISMIPKNSFKKQNKQ